MKEVKLQITAAFLKKINKKFKEREGFIESDTRGLIKQIIEGSTTFKSLQGGRLSGHFGFTRGTSTTVTQKLLDDLISIVKVEITPFTLSGNNIRGSVIVKATPIDARTIKTKYQQFILDENGKRVRMKDKSGKETSEFLPWVEWLFLDGGRNLVQYYHIVKGGGRSTLNKMEKGGFWKIPSPYSGELGNNWLTRAVDKNEGRIRKKLIKLLSLKG